jgi:hypothetical protein
MGNPSAGAHTLFNINKFIRAGKIMNVSIMGRLLFGLHIFLNMRKFMSKSSN